jgi:hypothetical protein
MDSRLIKTGGKSVLCGGLTVQAGIGERTSVKGQNTVFVPNESMVIHHRNGNGRRHYNMEQLLPRAQTADKDLRGIFLPRKAED